MLHPRLLGPLFSSSVVLLKFHLNMCSLGPLTGLKWDCMLLSPVVYGKTYWLTPTCKGMGLQLARLNLHSTQ